MIGGLMKALEKTRTAAAEGFDALDALREAIAAKRLEIERLHRAPFTVDAALRRFDAWADQMATRAVDTMDPGRLSDPSAAAGLRLPRGPVQGQIATENTEAVEAVLGLVLLACRPQIKATIRAQLEDLAVGKEALTDEERARRVGRAEKELRSALALEEIACRQLEEAGVAVARRADAPPEVVLATDTALARLAG